MSYLDVEIVPILNITPNLVFFSAVKNTDKIPLLAWTIIKKVIWVVKILKRDTMFGRFLSKRLFKGNESSNTKIWLQSQCQESIQEHIFSYWHFYNFFFETFYFLKWCPTFDGSALELYIYNNFLWVQRPLKTWLPILS